jgi:hypothetical protein
MAYMFGLPGGGIRWFTLALAGWFLVESAAWAAGMLVGPAGSGDATGSVPNPAPNHSPAHWVTRVSLAAMGLGMSYMLLYMQFGMAAMMSGSGHHHMP